jgi:hypothetical protein
MTFELFINAGDLSMTWVTQSDLIDPELVKIIGRKIDEYQCDQLLYKFHLRQI